MTSSASFLSGSWPGHTSFQLFAIAMRGLSGFSSESTATPAAARWALEMARWKGSSLSIARSMVSPYGYEVGAAPSAAPTTSAEMDDYSISSYSAA